jgi:hypothetical protein
MHAHAFLLGFFVSVENKTPIAQVPKRKVARWNRAGGTTDAKKSAGNRSARLGSPNPVICEFSVHAWKFDLGHVARNTPLGAYWTGRS